MPKYRKLHVKTIESLDLNDMPDDFTRLFWVLLPLALCREGRGLDNAAWLKSRIFPLREDISQDDVGRAFKWCVNRGMIVPYSVDGRDYFHVPTFPKYQGNTTKEAESDYPPPREPVPIEERSASEAIQTYSGPTPDLLQSKSGTDAICNMQYTDANATATADGADELAPASVADAVAALESFGMDQPDKVITETNLSPVEILDTLAYATEEKLGAGWVRTQLRGNHCYIPRAPDDYWRQFVENRSNRQTVGATPRGRPGGDP